MRIHHPQLDRTETVADSFGEVLIETAGWELVDGDAPTDVNPDGFPLDVTDAGDDDPDDEQPSDQPTNTPEEG